MTGAAPKERGPDEPCVCRYLHYRGRPFYLPYHTWRKVLFRKKWVCRVCKAVARDENDVY